MNAPKLIVTSLLSLAFFGLATSPIHAAEDPAAHKKMREEFQQAERIAAKSQSNTEAAQMTLEKLSRERKNWESETIHYKGTLSYSQAQLEHYTLLKDKEQIAKWAQEVTTAKGRLTIAETELGKVDAQIQVIVQNLQAAMKEPGESDVILTGETLEVMVLEDETLNGLYLVRRGGYITMKGVGHIQVAGKDLAGAEHAIKEELQKNLIKDANVTADRQEGNKGGNGPVIYLAGEFHTPGPWRIPPGVAPTVLTTILRSGGVAQSADLTRVRLLRVVSGQGLVEEVNVQAILDGVGLTSDMPLNPGDIIMIPAFANLVYVTGNVIRPGTVKLLPDDELTAHTAILRSGGFARFANRNKVFILRDRGNGEKQKIPVSIKAIEKGQGSDIILEPKDIVVVPEKFFSF